MDSTPTDSVEEPVASGEPSSSPADRALGRQADGGRVAHYREKLSAPPSYWFIAFLFGLSIAIILFVLGPWWSLIGLIVGTAGGGWTVAAYGSPVIEVLPGGPLKAGSAVLPAAALGAAVALNSERARAMRSYEADPRAFMLLRSYIPTAVRVEIVDPADPTPYLYLSSRRPEQLAAAVNALAR